MTFKEYRARDGSLRYIDLDEVIAFAGNGDYTWVHLQGGIVAWELEVIASDFADDLNHYTSATIHGA